MDSRHRSPITRGCCSAHTLLPPSDRLLFTPTDCQTHTRCLLMPPCCPDIKAIHTFLTTIYPPGLQTLQIPPEENRCLQPPSAPSRLPPCVRPGCPSGRRQLGAPRTVLCTCRRPTPLWARLKRPASRPLRLHPCVQNCWGALASRNSFHPCAPFLDDMLSIVIVWF